jgi:splicing factor 45
MMEKMGYKEGEGLGRNKQGMSVPLQVEKIGKRSGRVIHEKDIVPNVSGSPNIPAVASVPKGALSFFFILQ